MRLPLRILCATDVSESARASDAALAWLMAGELSTAAGAVRSNRGLSQ